MEIPVFKTTKTRPYIKAWYLSSKGPIHYHRLDGPAIEWWENEHYEWWENGKRHRIGGPAIMSRTRSEWWVNNIRHRLDGPAVVVNDGYKQWWVDGKKLNIKKVEIWIKRNGVDLNAVEGQIAFKLRFG